MTTHADDCSAFTGLHRLLRVPERLLGGLTATGTRLVREGSAVLAAIHAIPRLATALENLAPTADSLAKLAETRAVLDELARRGRHLTPTLDQLRALHEQIVEIACDLRALEPDIEGLAAGTASLDQSLRGLTSALGPVRSAAERIGRLADRNRADERRRAGERAD